MKTCPRCKTQFGENVKICSCCGAGDPALYCGKCGKELDLRYHFCNSCGQQFVLPAGYTQNKKTRMKSVNDKKTSAKRNKRKIAMIVGIFILLILIVDSVIKSRNARDELTVYSREIDRAVRNAIQNVPKQTESLQPQQSSTGYRRFYANGERLTFELQDMYLEIMTKEKTAGYLGYKTFEINEMYEKHDAYGRYIVKVEYKESEGQKWTYKTGYVYARYSDTKEIWYMPVFLEDSPDQSFLSAVHWDRDVPYEADLTGYAQYKEPVSSNPTEAARNNFDYGLTGPEEEFTYSVYNTYFDSADTTGYFSFEYMGFSFDFHVSKLEDGKKLVEAYCSDMDNYLRGSYLLDFALYDAHGTAFVDNEINIDSKGVYFDTNPSDLVIFFDIDMNGKTDFEIEFNAETNELLAGDGVQSRVRIAMIEWNRR